MRRHTACLGSIVQCQSGGSSALPGSPSLWHFEAPRERPPSHGGCAWSHRRWIHPVQDSLADEQLQQFGPTWTMRKSMNNDTRARQRALTHTHTHKNTCVCDCTNTHTHLHTHTHTHMFPSMHTHTDTQTHRHMNAFLPTPTPKHGCQYTKTRCHSGFQNHTDP